MTEVATLTYTNWRGDTEVRRVIPRHVWFGSTKWHTEPQWLLTALDVDKGEERDFALKDFGQPITVQDAARVLLTALDRAQIDMAILKLLLNRQPAAALRAIAEGASMSARISELGKTATQIERDTRAAIADAQKAGKLEGLKEAAELVEDHFPGTVYASSRNKCLAVLAARIHRLEPQHE